MWILKNCWVNYEQLTIIFTNKGFISYEFFFRHCFLFRLHARLLKHVTPSRLILFTAQWWSRVCLVLLVRWIDNLKPSLGCQNFELFNYIYISKPWSRFYLNKLTIKCFLTSPWGRNSCWGQKMYSCGLWLNVHF